MAAARAIDIQQLVQTAVNAEAALGLPITLPV
jgi:hypothetical protein